MHMRNAITMLGLVSALALSACGGSSENDVGRFLGTWRPTSGTFTEICPGYDAATGPVTSNVIWQRGVSSDLLTTDAATGCAVTADVNGSTATGVSPTCTVPLDGGAVATVSWTGYTFVISADGHTATENGSGTSTYVIGGATLPCTFTATGSYQKIGN
jgi:hypothetical protein